MRGAEVVASIGYTVRPGGDRLILQLSYRWTRAGEDGEDVELLIRLETTPLHFGGRRWWGICPLVVNGQACNRRVGKLYLPPGGRYFGCRQCYRLSYTSCQESHKYDGVFRALARDTGMDFLTVKPLMGMVGKRRLESP